MKYKAILCDDDQIILSGLKKLLPWSDIGIELCGCANNGKEAKDLIEKYIPDILVSDIKMPFFDGIQLAQYAKEINPDIKVIIISGYDDFNYAQNAMRAGAMDYILKPIDEKNLIAQLQKAVDNCKKQDIQKEMEKDHYYYLEEKMIQCLVFEGSNTFLKKYDINQLGKKLPLYCSVIIMEIDSYASRTSKLSDNELQEINDSFNKCVQQILGIYIGIFEQHPGTAGLYIFGESRTGLEKMRSDAIAKFQMIFAKHNSAYSVTFACGNTYNSILKLRDAYNEAQIAMDEQFVHPAGAVIFYSQICDKNKNLENNELESMLAEIDFVSLIKQEDKEEIERQLYKLRDALMKIGGKSYLYMRIVVGNLYARLYKEFKQLELERDGVKLDLLEEYKKTAECQNIECVITELKKGMYNIVDFVEKHKSSKYSKLMEKSLKYIEKHYIEHEFSIEDVATYVHMSPSYFSVIFKAEQGIAFTDYLIQMRMEQSKEYMKNTDMPIYEISYKVGYDTAAYFSSAFKKYTGYSPSIFKKNLEDERSKNSGTLF